MKVIVGIDGSSNSFAAAEFVGRLLSAERDELILLYATLEFALGDERLDPAIEQRARSVLSSTILNAAAERLPAAWQQRAAKREVAGAASARLLEAVDTEHADLLVVGFSGTSGLIQEFMLGSVCRTVVHAAKVPVLVVKSQRDSDEPAKQSAGSISQHINVLVAYDDAQLGERSAAMLKKFSWPPETRGWAMTAVPRMFVAELPDWIQLQRDPDVEAMAQAWELEHQQQLETARAELERFRAALPDCFTSEGLIVAEGRPAEAILAQVLEKAVDLVAVGSRSSGTMQRLLLGSTSEQVLREVPCSVLVVR